MIIQVFYNLLIQLQSIIINHFHHIAHVLEFSTEQLIFFNSRPQQYLFTYFRLAKLISQFQSIST
mgnify:CR=1 FL=1